MESVAERVAPAEQTSVGENMIVPLTYGFAFVSGAAALIYQVVWVKMISLSFGSTTLAAGAVIGSFMAGMGIGARFYDVIYSRYRHAFKLYALLEIGIAVTTFLITSTLYSLPHVYAAVHHAIESRALLGTVRFVSVFFILLVPSALMGATFPALCTALIRSATGVGRHLGMIYGVNTLGAAAGSVAAGFVLIEMLGNTASTWVANACNLAIGFGALWLWRQVRSTSLDQPPPPTVETALESRLPRVLIGAVLIGSGFATMAYEVFWIRALKYVVGNSTYAISMVLVIFLIGLGLGGVLFRRVIARKDPEHDLGVCQLAIGTLALVAVGLESFMLTQPWFAQHVSIFSISVQTMVWPLRLLLATCVSIVLLLPPTIAMGLSFPLASRLYIEDVRKLGSNVGTAYLLANIGSILGVIIAAVVLLPMLGTGGATKLVAAINVLLGLAVLLYMRGWTPLRTLSAVGAVAICGGLALVVPLQLPFQGEVEIALPTAKVIFSEESDIATVHVVDPYPGKNQRVMTIDGYSIGKSGTHDVIAYKQELLAHFPMLLKPNARRTLNIGLGSGSTLATLATYPNIEVLDCVEIVPGVLDGARHFEKFGKLDDPRVHVHIDDAVHFLLTSQTKYDIIIADGKQNPKFAGNAAILSEEFHHYCLDHLADDGLLIEWLSPTRPPRSFNAAMRAFCDVFPEVAAYYFVPTAVAVVGSKKPIGNNPEIWPEVFRHPRALEDMRDYSIESPMTLLASRVAEGDRLRRIFADKEKNTWDHPVLEFIAYKEFYAQRTMDYCYTNLKLLVENAADPRALAGQAWGLPSKYLRSTRLLQKGYVNLYETEDSQVLHDMCEEALGVNPGDSLAQGVLNKMPANALTLIFPGKPE